MAVRSRRHASGVDGDWFIDDRCIGCGASRSIAPDLINGPVDGTPFVFRRQPSTPDEVARAEQAAEVCPTRSIGTVSGRRWDPHHPMLVAPDVWRTGWNDPDAVGGNGFLIERDGGNVLVDGPRFVPRLRDFIAARGGLRAILLTHRDDVGATQRYAETFDAEVVIHEADADAAPFATRLLRGGEPVDLGDGVTAVPTPGHTAGHVMFIVDSTTLLSGDSLTWEPDRNDLWAEELVCWDSWPDQLDSLEQLARHDFTTVVPTHGAISPTLPVDEMRARLLHLVTQLRGG